MSLLPDFAWKLKYTPEDGDLVKLFYVPALCCATRYDRSTGFFTATSLALAARGIEGLVANSGVMRLVVGCTLEKAEVEAIRKGEELRTAVEQHLGRMPLQPETPETTAALELLAWMVAKGILEVRVAVPCDPQRQPIASNGIFHEKAGIVEDKAGHRLAWNGSLNETVFGWQKNWESINVFESWNADKPRVEAEEKNFSQIWAGQSAHLLTLDVPSAIRQDLLKYLPTKDVPARLRGRETGLAPNPEPRDSTPNGADAGLDEAERRRLLWGFVKHAPAFDRPGAERVGEATAAVVPWPHQIQAFERMYRNWPPRLLIADEVGLGKTIEAGLLLRQAWLAGRAQRILILAPKAVLKQWQLELREKFNLNWPIYDGQRLEWCPSPALNGHSQQPVAPGKWHEQAAVIASSQLMRRSDRAAEILQHAQPWDLVILDEAHHARRKSPGNPNGKGPNGLLRLARGLSEKTRGLILLTATPLQVHPVEVWDLLSLLGIPPEWTESEFARFYEILAKPAPSSEEMEQLVRLFRSVETLAGELSPEEVQAISAVSRLTAKRLLGLLRDRATVGRRSMRASDRDAVKKILRQNSPVGRLILRNTRDLLRRYYREGRIQTPIADRIVDDRFLQMTSEEQAIYQLVEEYILRTYKQASPESKTAVGFVMTIYRKRLASSFYALSQTLEKRLASIAGSGEFPTEAQEEDLPDDDLAEEQPDTEELTAAEKEALNFEEWSAVEDLLHRVRALPPDTKSHELRRMIGELRAAGYSQAIVFTQFTDTMDFLRDQLVSDSELKIMCFSGRGGEIPIGDHTWEKISRDEVRRRFRTGNADILLCTDAAAEGLNFQYCGALINYDLPWNPMRVEQRIGRIDRLGQKYPKIRIVNLQYEGTIETTVYRVLRKRIGFFTSVVGKLQPILASVSQRISAAVLGKGGAMQADQVARQIEDEARSAEEKGFDLDQFAPAVPEPEKRPDALYDLDTLRGVLHEHDLFLPEVAVTQASAREFRYLAPGGISLRVTVDPEYYEDHTQDVELWSPGNPLFPTPAVIASREDAELIDPKKLIWQANQKKT